MVVDLKRLAFHQGGKDDLKTEKLMLARIKNLTKTCSNQECAATVSFMKETMFNMVLSGPRETDMKERFLTAAYLNAVTNINNLI